MRNQPNSIIQIAGAHLIINEPTVHSFLLSIDDNEDTNLVKFLWNKHTEYSKYRDRDFRAEKYIIMSGISSAIEQIIAPYLTENSIRTNTDMQNSIYNALEALFRKLVEDLDERTQNPVKSCVLLPGRYGRPAACPEKNSESFQKCKDTFSKKRKLAARIRIQKDNKGFIAAALDLFDAIQNEDCKKFERIDNFAMNKGMTMKDDLKLFRILAEIYYNLLNNVRYQKVASNISSTSINSGYGSNNTWLEYRPTKSGYGSNNSGYESTNSGFGSINY